MHPQLERLPTYLRVSGSERFDGPYQSSSASTLDGSSLSNTRLSSLWEIAGVRHHTGQILSGKSSYGAAPDLQGHYG